jgi:exosome complex RNA-binding protein Csl4
MFECHITVSTEHAETANNIAKLHHFKTSEIARDPVLGDKNFFYLTTHSKDYGDIWNRMKNCVRHFEEVEVPVIREKIELIVHDTKVKV